MDTQSPHLTTCTACGTAFHPRVSYQIEKRADGTVRAFCSLPCKAGASAKGGVRCDACQKPFALTFAYQAKKGPHGAMRYACSETCRAAIDRPAEAPPPTQRPYRVAVLNQKGGTGKTTTSISLASGLAEQGCHVLLVDADPQGNVGVSLGVRSEHSLYHVLMEEVSVADAVVPLGERFDLLTSDDSLAAAEVKLAQHPARGGVLTRRLHEAQGYTHVIVDCGPSLSLINQNALCYVDEVLVPVACDYLSLVGVKQVLKTVRNINQHLGHPLRVGAVLPTFYDARAKICRDVLDALQKHFGPLCLPPVRMNTKLKEAPSHKKTIFEHDPNSTGAEDYRVVVKLMFERGQEMSQASQTTPPTAASSAAASPIAASPSAAAPSNAAPPSTAESRASPLPGDLFAAPKASPAVSLTPASVVTRGRA